MIDGQTWEVVRQIAIIIATLAAGGPGVVRLVDWLKATFDLSGQPVWWLAAGVSLVAALAAGVVDGLISPDTLQAGNIAEITLGVFFTSQAYYKMAQGQREKARVEQLRNWQEQ